MKFNKIVCVDNTKLDEKAISDLQRFSREEVEVYSDYPESEEEVIKRIGNAEAVLVSWHTYIGEEIITACADLKYIGMACSLYDDESANVAVKFAESKNIRVKGIRDYGDPGVAEFIISELIQLLNGYKGIRWRKMPTELTDLKIGIIGLGITGKLLADCLLPFKADLYYFSRDRKMDYEKKGIRYLELPELLRTCEIISLHLPRNVQIFQEKEFREFGEGKILINTSLGKPFSENAFSAWINRAGNYAIFDADGKASISKKIEGYKNVIASQHSAGWSIQTRQRLSSKVVDNVKIYCKQA